MIVLGFIFFYWIIALILAIPFSKYDICGFCFNGVEAAILWPTTLFYYIVIYPFISIHDKYDKR